MSAYNCKLHVYIPEQESTTSLQVFFFVPVKGGGKRAFLQKVTENTQKELSFVKGGHPILNSGHNKSRLFCLLYIRPIVRSLPGLVNQSPKFPQFCLKRPVFTSAGTFCTTFEVRCPSAHKLSNQASFCKKTHISALVSSKTFLFHPVIVKPKY